MWLIIGQTIWFFLPAGIANMAASLSRFLPVPDTAVDHGATWRGKRLFGAHKTWRGGITGVVAGTLFFLLQQYWYQYDWAQSLSIINYSQTTWTLGILFALGAILGDMIESTIKRQMNIDPGKPWVPFDQLDYVIGAVVLSSVITFPGWIYVLIAVGLGFGLHILVNILSYILGIQKNKL